MKKFLTVFIVMRSLSVFSQQKEITGKVTDDTGQPVMGATLVIKGTNNGTVTNFDGEYTLKAKAGDVISFSFIGTETKNVTVANAAIINVMLKGSEQVLDEIVVVGYGKVKKSDLTGSVSSVKADDVTKSGTLAIDQALAGRVAGAVVTQNSGTPGAGASITIRGVSTISSSQPLYVIDGVPMENEGESGLNSEDQGSANLSPLSLINPSDIESIEILKDASASAIYGSRGSSGVILITTKSGRKNTPLTVSYNMEKLRGFLFDTKMRCCLDWEAWYRISQKEGSFCYSDKSLMYHRIHDESETSNAIADNTRTNEEIMMFHKYWPSFMVKILMKFYIKAQNTNQKEEIS